MDIHKAESLRAIHEEIVESDVCVVGGGLAGTCAAITAARQGVTVVLVHDRPVLGGNASSEVRLWTLGATSHMKNNNRWAREGGVIDEILVENMFRNPEGNPMFFDTILLELVTSEKNIRLMLNTSAQELAMDGPAISEIAAYNSQNEMKYKIKSRFYIDSSGDGVVSFQAGVPFRFGAESSEEFGEKFAPDPEIYGERLGHSIFFYTKDVGKPVRFVAPAYALKDVPKHIPRYRSFDVSQNGCQFWWIEYGGRLDTVHDTELIKWELWKVVLGVWDYIKNSGDHPEAENLTLEWMGAIPGKRESRRFEGYSMLIQQDVIEQRAHEDAVSYGGWSIDLHPADGVYSAIPGCTQLHAKGVYQIPYSVMVTPHVENLFIAGRIISASHVAFGTTRVMATCANGAQAVGMAAALGAQQDLLPADFRSGSHLRQLQLNLTRAGQYIPQLQIEDSEDISAKASITASSEMVMDFADQPAPGRVQLDKSRAQLIPLPVGKVPSLRFRVDVSADTQLSVKIMRSDKPFNFTPEVELSHVTIDLNAGFDRAIVIPAKGTLDSSQYIFVLLEENPLIRVHCTEKRVSGLISVAYWREQKMNKDVGVEEFAFWPPDRRPGGKLFAISVDEAEDARASVFDPHLVANTIHRPVGQTNCWVAAIDDPLPTITLRWEETRSIRKIQLFFDTDADHPMESVLWGHPERAMPSCIRSYSVHDDSGDVVWDEKENHQTRNLIELDRPVNTKTIEIRVHETWGNAPAALFGVHCYSDQE